MKRKLKNKVKIQGEKMMLRFENNIILAETEKE